jgi:hypothetical protein
MAQYLLLIYDSPTAFEGLSPDEMQRIIGEYSAWAARLKDDGKLVASQKLRDGSGRVVRPRTGGGMKVLDGPYSETKEVIGGYFLIEATSYDEALRACEASPHLRYGGTIEVREIEDIGTSA